MIWGSFYYLGLLIFSANLALALAPARIGGKPAFAAERTRGAAHYHVEAEAKGFKFRTPNFPKVTAACLRANSFELVILDPGHDDSDDSRRSDAKVRGGDGSYKYLWPEIHEGRLNMVTSYLAYDMLLTQSGLSVNERLELQSMLRFSRLPGEKEFGQFASWDGYASSTGVITSGVTNRRTTFDTMITTHRPFDPTSGSWIKDVKVGKKIITDNRVNVENKALLLSVHANSSDFFDEGDYIWIIPPTYTKPDNLSSILTGIGQGFSKTFRDFLQVEESDSPIQTGLKRDAEPSTLLENILYKNHSKNLAVLRSGLKTKHRVLLEGFVMNGKIGHLAHLDITGDKFKKKLEFKRKGRVLYSYDFAEVYRAYAESIVRGLGEALACQ